MTIPVDVRWMIRRDLPRVLEIERQCFGDCAWVEEDFIGELRQRNCIGMVAECGDDVRGYMVYQLEKSRLHVINFAVDPKYMRSGIGTRMVEKLRHKLNSQRRREIILEVRETNLAAQLFFRSQGFRAVKVVRDWFLKPDETHEDGIVMRYRMREPQMEQVNAWESVPAEAWADSPC